MKRDAQLILLRGEHSQNKEPRLLPLTGELSSIIGRRWKERVVKRADGSTSLAEFVFHSGDGSAIGKFRKAWRSACTKADMPQLLFHDLRRSAIRNFDQAGVSQLVGMLISGHKTPNVYRRYRITPEKDIREALEKTQRATSTRKKKQVVSIRRTKDATG